MELLDYSLLNPGIRKMVQLLREAGFNTTDSGDGATHDCECDHPNPYVSIEVDPESLVQQAQAIKKLLVSKGVSFPIPQSEEDAESFPFIEANYSPVDDYCLVYVGNILDKDLTLLTTSGVN